ncbi:hypothetical protein MLD38_003670 [Melastoma candidum]|uniref:Uncharacterized protein n=1 Tax=Melastoma candidum TaxID=119954 RepID=A0ACB9S4W3_9MYRT|nr:hypothetical protein MLD38_003670 [Melastoma candidum]
MEAPSNFGDCDALSEKSDLGNFHSPRNLPPNKTVSSTAIPKPRVSPILLISSSSSWGFDPLIDALELSSAMSLSLKLFILFLAILNLPAVTPTEIGVTCSRSAASSTPPNATSAPPTPERVADAVTDLKIHGVRLPDPTPQLVRAFLYTNTCLLLSIPNSLVPSLAANRSDALSWLYTNVIPFYPRVRITAISVGNNPLDDDESPLFDSVLPAIQNIRSSLEDLGIHKIAVSTTFSFISVMTSSFPPSSASFQQPLLDTLIRPLLQFLKDTNSSFMINLYPYNLYRLHSEVPIAFALFQEQPFLYRDDVVTGVRYRNLFDMMVDAVVVAMTVAGHENVPIIVAETGWPSASTDVAEVDANEAYAQMFVKGLVAHLRSGVGTPLRKEGVAEAYIYELIDRGIRRPVNGASSPQSRNWGLLYQNLTRKYDIQFTSAGTRRGPGSLVGTFCWVIVAFGWSTTRRNTGFC